MNDTSQTAKHVLVVEDEPDFSALIAAVLDKEGYEVTVVYTAEEAWEQVRKRSPDLITLDLQLPQSSGLHFYRELKSHETFGCIPVVVISGVVCDDPDMSNFVRSFLDVEHRPRPEAFIEKPFDNQELTDAAANALARA